VVVSGASGVGKSRFGYEIYRRTKKEKSELGLYTVNYAVINISRLATQGLTQLDVVQHLVRKHTHCNGKNNNSLQPSPRLNFEALVPILARGALGTVTNDSLEPRAGLVLHLDEFHHDPAMATMIMRAVESFTTAYLDTKVVLVLTGLYTPVEVPSLRRLVSVGSRIVPLGYFVEGNSTDLHKTWELVRNAVNDYGCSHHNLLPVEQAHLPSLLSYLLEDIGGWAFGATLLGVELASTGSMSALSATCKDADIAPTRSQALMALNGLTMGDFSRCEQNVYSMLRHKYRDSLELIKTKLKDAGTVKLIAFLLSPFRVRVYSVLAGVGNQSFLMFLGFTPPPLLPFPIR
jgi:hypothetical protein